MFKSLIILSALFAISFAAWVQIGNTQEVLDASRWTLANLKSNEGTFESVMYTKDAEKSVEGNVTKFKFTGEFIFKTNAGKYTGKTCDVVVRVENGEKSFEGTPVCVNNNYFGPAI